ncbi:MAG: sigma-54 dependent transcriptional regulator [Acidihalobacter sp.]
MASILIVDDEYSVRTTLGLMLKARGHTILEADSVAQALGVMGRHRVDLMITDLRLGDGNGLELLDSLRDLSPQAECIVMTAFASVENAVDAMRLGAYDYLTKPVNPDELLLRVVKVLERKSMSDELSRLRAELDGRADSELVAESDAMRKLVEVAQRIHSQDVPVLITGETGVGKEVLARVVHRMSSRAQCAFVAVNCATLPEDLLDSELFGHAKGAFTGALTEYDGLFRQAHGGTLFLDEVGDVSPRLQAKLLRVLQEGEVRPVGGNRPVQVDVRVIAATNLDLAPMVQSGAFRADLLFRLNVLPLAIPPLRERREDIPPLLERFIGQMRRKTGRPLDLSAAARRRLMAFDWPGNVRQLRNVLERSFALTDADLLDVDAVALDSALDIQPPAVDELQPDDGEIRPLAEVEHAYIRRALDACEGNQVSAAKQLGISRSTLRRKLGLD